MARSNPDEPKLIKCRVRPNNAYGQAKAGDVVDVEEAELRLVPHCLVSLEDERREAEEAAREAKRVTAKGEAARVELEGYQRMSREALAASRKSAALREQRRSEQSAKEATALLNPPVTTRVG